MVIKENYKEILIGAALNLVLVFLNHAIFEDQLVTKLASHSTNLLLNIIIFLFIFTVPSAVIMHFIFRKFKTPYEKQPYIKIYLFQFLITALGLGAVVVYLLSNLDLGMAM